MGTFNIANQIDVRDVNSNIDLLYGPYRSVAEALLAIPINRRALGRTLGVIENCSVVEYWWKSGLTDDDLVTKMADTTPKLEYTDDYPEGTVLRADVGQQLVVKVRFTSSTYGPCTISITKDGTLLRTVKADKGIITLNLGMATSEGTSIYTITGVDALTIPASDELTFKAVVGGASIVSDMQDIIDGGINTESNISITYNAFVADSSKAVKVLGQLINSSGSVVLSHNNAGSGSNPNVLSNQRWDVGVISMADSYILKMWAYTGATPDDTSGDNVTRLITYTFTLMAAGDFKMSAETTTITADTNTAIIIPFRIYSGSAMALQAHGELYDDNGDIVAGYELNRTVQSNARNFWSLGKVAVAGTYSIKMWATTVGGEDAPSGRHNVFIDASISQYIPSYAIVTDGLMAQFLADGKSNNRDQDTAGYWKNELADSNIYFALKDLNYNTNGWKHVDESIPDSDPEGEMMLKFSGDSFGRLKAMQGRVPADSDPDYFPMVNLASAANTGFTAEIIFRSRCVGELKSKVMTGHLGGDTNTAGFSASYDTVSVGSNDAQVRLDVSENEWIHATLVIDKTTRLTPDDSQDYAPKKLMTVYINGSACGAAIITDNMTFTNYGPVMLNSAINTLTGEVGYFGQSEIKAIRFYNRPLLASEVVNNYIASIYDPEKQSETAGRNGDVLPIVHFINKNAQYPLTQKEIDGGVTLVDFATLNQMTEKAQQKKKYVHGDVIYKDTEDHETVWQHVMIQTQGTSTLAFPVKNYKIKMYLADFKTKAYTDAFRSLGWLDDYVYTLKCDYMEAAHLNNTPSCEFYNGMIDDLVESGDIATGWNTEHTVYTAAEDGRTPSRREEHFDAIKGFPCLVYYYESEEDYLSNNGTYVGTYMFNLDKAAKSLGFEDAAELDTDGETIVPVPNPRYGLDVDSGEDQYCDNICQSFEGVANGSDTAGCFYSYADWKDSFYHTYCEAAFEIYKGQGGELESLAEFVETYAGALTRYRDDDGEHIPVDYEDHGYLNTEEDYIDAASPYEDEYAYFAADFEMRYDYDDLEEGGEEFWGNSDWGLKRMIDWVSSASKTVGTSSNQFKEEFNDYFNFDYCALYYLQMIVFGQVDNAGKNSMWDTWDGLHWAPRPYDCDTMAGLDNTGFEVISPDAELLQSLSPFQKYNATTGTADYSEDVSDIAGIRYRAYNTRTSKFWIAFATSFKTELEALYKTLRDSGTYSIENIADKFVGKTSAIIGESYYNRDMTTKFYKLADIDTFITRMHGNRVQRFKAWMTDRIVFCDTYFNYTNDSDSLNNNIVLRSDAVETSGTISVRVGIKTYSPQYVRIDVGSGYDAKIEAYCSPDSRYIDPITGETKEGLLFTIPLAGGDKEIQISGGGNIREIVNLEVLKPKSLTLMAAKKLVSLDLSYSTKLLALSLSNNTYLQSLDCNGAVQLGSDAAGAQLDLSNCPNLKTVNLDNTKLTSVVFPVGGSLKAISVKNTTITAISLDSLHFLTSVDVTGCTNILTYSITNCPKMTSLSADDLPLTGIYITNCVGLESISLQYDNQIEALTINTCPNITHLYLNSNRSSAISTLDLTTFYNLEYLNITGATVSRIKFPLNRSAASTEPWGDNFTQLIMLNSMIQHIQYGESTNTGVDLSQLTGLESLSFSQCAYVQHVYNMNYVGSCASLFANCTSLIDVAGSITCNGSASSMFYNCRQLNDLSNVTFNFSGCTSLSSAFQYCNWITYAQIKNILDRCSTSLKSISSMCRDKANGVTYTSAQKSAYTTLPNNFFGNCKGVTDASTCFYYAGLTALSINAFTDSSGNNGLAACTDLRICFAGNVFTDIPTTLMGKLPSVQNAAGMFLGCSSVTTTLPENFFGASSSTSTITSIQAMFSGCSSLNVNLSTAPNIMAPLKNLTNASIAFYGCTKMVGAIPVGFFSNNTKLTTVTGFFKSTKVSSLPSGSLFRTSGSTANITTLTDISGLFDSCTSLSGNVRSDLFAGVPNVTDAGIKSVSTPTGGSITMNGVFYGCTGLLMFSKDTLTTMPALRNVSGFFKNCTGLIRQTESETFNGAMLNTHANLRDVHDLFNGCSSLVIPVIPELFTASKSTITNVSGAFRGCTSISDFESTLVANMPALSNASYLFYGCTSLGTTMTNITPFAGDSSLENVSYCFYNCNNIAGTVPASLFNSCRATLKDVSHMFHMSSDIATTKSLTGIGVGNEDTVAPTSPNYQLGLLAECLALTTTASMFSYCESIVGKIPWDMFYTESVENLYTTLKDVSNTFYCCKFGTATHYAADDIDYVFHPEFFSKLIAITTTEGMFSKPSSRSFSWGATYPIHPNAFSNQYFLTTIKEMFYRFSALGGAVPNTWFRNCITTLTNAYGAFAHTGITEVGNLFLRASADTANNKLSEVSRMFYGCSSIHSDLPKCDNIHTFSKINYNNPDTGYYGYAYGCTNATNYNTFEEPWRRQLIY